MYTLPLGYAARAMRAVSAGTGEIACGLSDIGVLLMALPDLLVLRFLISLFLYRQLYRRSPVVSGLVNRRIDEFFAYPGSSLHWEERVANNLTNKRSWP